jgi:hypothetical protein
MRFTNLITPHDVALLRTSCVAPTGDVPIEPVLDFVEWRREFCGGPKK